VAESARPEATINLGHFDFVANRFALGQNQSGVTPHHSRTRVLPLKGEIGRIRKRYVSPNYMKNIKRSSTILLQVVIVLIGIGALAFMLWEPHIEGRNVSATLFEIYFNDPFLAYAYIASIAFFVALYQAFKLFGYLGQNTVFSEPAVKALRTIKYCATSLVGFVVVAEAYLLIVRPGDDIAGGVFIGLLLIFVFGVVDIVTKRFERIVQTAVDKK